MSSIRKIDIKACFLVRMKIKKFLTYENTSSNIHIRWKEEKGVLSITVAGEEDVVESMINKISRKELTSTYGIIHNTNL